MSRERVNSISNFVRRLSKTLSLKRTSVSSADAEELAEYVHRPHAPLHTTRREHSSRSVERTRDTQVPARASSAYPAPLATADCFDITDVSDIETGTKDKFTDEHQAVESENGSLSPISHTDSEETPIRDKYYEDKDPGFTLSGIPSDQIYDFSYPVVEREETETGSMSTVRRTESSIYGDESDITYSEEESENQQQHQQPETGSCVPEIREDIQEGESDENTGEEGYREVYQDDYEFCNYPQTEVQPDPFSEAMLRAEQHHLTTSPPAILVTSPSNQDITQRSPSRPPPPIDKPTAPPVPPPPKEIPENSRTGPSRPPPPRPTTKPPGSITAEASPTTPRKKKHKIFGINVGPLPSDLDPNFPFQSHFEKKHILPNPKKGLQNIIGGEKRKQRLKRKEEAELQRIIKSAPKTQPIKEQEDQKVSPAKGYLSDWREFQARIQATVTDTTSRLESLKWAAEPTQDKAETSCRWANFEAYQEPKVEENWAEFAEEEPEEHNHTEVSFYQETQSDYSVKGEPFEESAEPAVQEDDWADFDNLRTGDQATEQTVNSLPQTTVDEWSSQPQPERKETTNNWADIGASGFPESSQSVSDVPSDNNWEYFFLNQSGQGSDYPDEEPQSQGQTDLIWLESKSKEHQLQIVKTSTEAKLNNVVEDFYLPANSSKTQERVPGDLGSFASEPKDNQKDYFAASSEKFTPEFFPEQIQTLGRQISHLQENSNFLANFETEPIPRNTEVKSRETPISQSSSFDQHSSTPSQIQHYGYDDPSSQLTTEISQSSVDEPTVMEESSPDNLITDREHSKNYDYDKLTNSNDNIQRNSQPAEYGTSYGYDDPDVEKPLAQERSSVSSSELNEFVSNVIDTAETEMKTQEISPEIVELYTNSGRTKPKAVRQGTLTENNPFRRASRTENPENIDQGLNDEQLALDDEKTTLATVTLFSQSVHDEDEEMEEAPPEYENEELATTPKNRDFDPFQTIYPASDGDSSSENEDESGRAIPQISIKTEKLNNTKSGLETVNVPILPAPPKTETPAYAGDLNVDGDQDEFESRFAKTTDSLAGMVIDSSVPEGWETFTSDTITAPGENCNATDDELVKAFEVDWSKSSVPVAAMPEAPRPETPDPELEIPFNPPSPENPVWRMWIRYPEKKKKVKQVSKYTTDRTWKEIAITLSDDRGRCEVNLHDIDPESKEYVKQSYRTLRMEPYMQLSRCKLQQYDKYGKLNIFKINHVAYKELPGMRPEKFSIKTFQNLISHKPKQNVALDHLPVYTEILKFGSMDRSFMRSLMTVLEDSLMKIPAHKDEGINYTHEEVCCYVEDEYVGKLSVSGIIEEQKARTRIFCSAFVNGSPHIVLGINDKWRFGREVVRRSDILPVLHDDWITIWKPEFHSCLEMDDYENDHLLKFYPLDGCKFELMRFRVSLRHNRELPMQVHCTYSIDDRRVSMRCELMVPGYFTATGRSGATPCEDVEIRIPVPEEWIYHFRVEKHHKMGSVHSTLRKPGKIKGLERITQMAQSLLPPSLLEASIGLAKYEHIFKAIVWRISRVPDKNEASYRPHLLTCNLLLNPHDTVPEWDTLEKVLHIEFSMPSTTVSGTTVRSISVETTGNAEKFVKYTAKYRLTKSIDYQLGHRKDKPLVGILDAEEEEQNSSSDSESEPHEDENKELQVNADDSQESKHKVTLEGGVAVDDLLGEGLSSTTPTHPASSSTAQPGTSQSNELVDIFG